MTPLQKGLKQNALTTWILSGITFTLLVLYCILGSQLWLMGLVLLFLSSTLVNVYDRKRIRRSYCPHCEEQYDYDNDVAWECSNVVTGGQTQKADVEIQCLCRNCGRATQFKKRFKTAEIDTLGRVKEYNLYNIIRKYFKM